MNISGDSDIAASIGLKAYSFENIVIVQLLNRFTGFFHGRAGIRRMNEEAIKLLNRQQGTTG
jgi:hypothetical protein